MEVHCPHCASQHVVKNGSVKGARRWLCRGCQFTFTRLTPRGKPLSSKALAVILYVHGLSLNATAKIVGVSTVSVLRWVRSYAKEHYEKPAPEGSAVVIELDEMWHFLKKSLAKSGSGKPCVVIQADSWTGNSAIVILPHSNH